MRQSEAPAATQSRARCVRFSLLAELFASGPRGPSWREQLPPGMATAGGHLVVLLSVLFMLPARPAVESMPETVTYLDIPPPPAAGSPRSLLPPRPPVVRQGLRIPAVQPDVARPGMLAGFQELLAPDRVTGLPPVEGALEAVSELDFKGRGVAGGVAGGEKPKEVPAPTDSTPIVAAAWYEAAAVEEPPMLLNRTEIPTILRDLYPPLLLQAGVGGAVKVEFVVDSTGEVADGSVRILSSPQPQLASVTGPALKRFRFRPGRVVVGGQARAVAVLVQMTVQWTVTQGGFR